MLHIFGNVLRGQWILNVLHNHETTGRKENVKLRANHDLQMAEVRSSGLPCDIVVIYCAEIPRVVFLLFYFLFFCFVFPRIFPVYGTLIVTYIFILPYINDGPYWRKMIYRESERCQTNWWTNVLYINNYVHTDELVNRNKTIIVLENDCISLLWVYDEINN